VKAGPKAQPKASTLPRLRARTPSSRFAEFCRRFLTHQQGPLAGRPLVLAPWQREIVARLLDTVDEHGMRRYRVALLTLARRNGKTLLAAALALFELYYGEVGGEIIGAAGDRQQAHLAFDVARKMVEASPALEACTLIYRRQLVVPHRGSAYRVVSSDAPRQHGINLSFGLVDELHAHRDRRLYDALTTGTGSRAQPLVVVISTATDDPHSIMAELYEYAVKVRDGLVVDPSFLPVIFSVPADADPFDETVWPLANPALGDFRSLAEFRTAAMQAREIPGRLPTFRALYLNQMFTGAETRWLPLEAWDDACAPLGSTIDPGAAMSVSPRRRAFLGLDLAATADVTALAVWLPAGDGTFDLRVEFWVPADTIAERERAAHVPYRQWVAEGWLHATPGNVTDYGHIEKRIHEYMVEHDLRTLAVDPWNARDLSTRLAANAVPVVEVAQTMANLSGASKAFETLILSGRLRHDGNPVMRWMVSNTVAATDSNGNLKPDKRRSREKIDGVSAAVTGLTRALLDVEPASVYDLRGPLVVAF
jgi:phage terminase large subunit-like protein